MMVSADQSTSPPKSFARPTPHGSGRASQPAWHDRFLRLLPAIRRHAQVCFRQLPRQRRDEAIDEVVGSALVAYARLVELNKEDVAYASPLARYAVAQFRAGRRVGVRLNSRDVMSEYCQRRTGLVVERLDRFDRRAGQWQEMLVEDRRSTPADVAAIKLDFRAWLTTLGKRDRQIAENLAIGESTNSVAEQFGISASRVSQLRRSFYDAWQALQGEPALCAS